MYAPPARVFHGGIPKVALQHAQTHAQHAVSHAERALPPMRHPHVPIIEKPTAGQAYAALKVIHESQRRALGRNPTPAKEAAYQQSLLNDPRLRQFREATRHYHAAGSRLSDLTPFAEAEEYGAGPLEASKYAASDAARSIMAADRARAVPRVLRENAESKAKSSGIKVAGINLSHIAGALAGAHLLPTKGALGILGKAGNEVIDLPAQTFLSSAIAGSAARSAAEGKPEALKNIGGSVLSQIEHPVKSFKEAPLATGLTFAGGEAAIEGALARVARGLSKGALRGADIANLTGRPLTRGERFAAAIDTRRPDLQLYNNESVPQRYNSLPSRKALQRLAETTIRPNLPAGEIKLFGGKYRSGTLRQAHPFKAEGYRLKRATVGGIVKAGQIDYIRPAGERTRRSYVKPNVAALDEVRPKVGEEAVSMAAQGILKGPHTLEEDLAAEAKSIKDAQKGTLGNGGRELKGKDLKANKDALEVVERLKNDKEFLASRGEEAFHAAEVYKALLKPLTRKRLIHGSLLPEQLKAALYPYAQRHMGARHYVGKPHPQILKDYAEGQASIAETAARLKAAEAHLKAKQSARDRTAGARGHGIPTQRARAAEGGGTALAAAEGALRGAREDFKAAEKAHAEAKHDAPTKPAEYAALRGPDGQELTQQEILDHMHENGVTVGHVTHQQRGKAAYYTPTTELPRVESYQRTGAALEKGTVDHSWEQLKGSLAANASKVAQAEVRTRELNRLGIGRFKNRKAAEDAAGNLTHDAAGNELRPGLGDYVPVLMGAKQILEKGHVKPTELADALEKHGLEEHTPVPHDEQGTYTLIPRKVNERIEAHDTAVSARHTGKKLAQMYTQGFRRAKLYTSTRHVVGVAQELGIRLVAEQALPRALGGRQAALGRMSRQHLEALAEDTGPLGPKYRELNDALGSRGSLYTSTQDNDIVRKATEALKPGNLTPARAWRAYYKTLQKGMHKVEQGAYDPLLGKAIGEFLGGWRKALKDQDAAMARIRNMTPQEADGIARRVDDMMGNWSHQTPEVRRAVQAWSPFGLWWLNSMRWLYRLPVTHPVKLGIAAALYNATRKERGEKGQGYGAAHPVPGFLTGTIDVNLPILGKVKANPTYYSPMGVATEPGNVAAEQVFTQLTSPLAALEGVNPLTHEKLKDAEGRDISEWAKLINAATETVAGPTPGATQVQQLEQMGGKPIGTANWLTDALGLVGAGPSQVKPDTQRSLPEVLAKMFLPTRVNREQAGSSGSVEPEPVGPAPSGAGIRRGSALQSRAAIRRSSALESRRRLGGAASIRRALRSAK